MEFKTEHPRAQSDTIIGSCVIEPLLDSEAAAKILGVSTSWLAKGRVYGYGPDFIEIGRSIHYSPSALLNYAAAQTRKPSDKRGKRTTEKQVVRTD
jgi:hypothetical protein